MRFASSPPLRRAALSSSYSMPYGRGSSRRTIVFPPSPAADAAGSHEAAEYGMPDSPAEKTAGDPYPAPRGLPAAGPRRGYRPRPQASASSHGYSPPHNYDCTPLPDQVHHPTGHGDPRPPYGRGPVRYPCPQPHYGGSQMRYPAMSPHYGGGQTGYPCPPQIPHWNGGPWRQFGQGSQAYGGPFPQHNRYPQNFTWHQPVLPESQFARQPHPQPPLEPRLADYRREWCFAHPRPPPQSEKFTVLSYNILADYLARDHSLLYSHIPKYVMDWEWRKSKLLFELNLWSPDIMCLQEVDRFHELNEQLVAQGYSGIWTMRTGKAVDGCATFWRSNRFKLRYEEHIEYNKLELRDNVAQICVLESHIPLGVDNVSALRMSSTGTEVGNLVVICNTHVYFNPKRGEIKLGQVRMLLQKADAISKAWSDAPVVVCGDFNCTPESALYNFLSSQKLCLSGLSRTEISGQHSAGTFSRRPFRSSPSDYMLHDNHGVASFSQNDSRRNEHPTEKISTVGIATLPNNPSITLSDAKSINNCSSLSCTTSTDMNAPDKTDGSDQNHQHVSLECYNAASSEGDSSAAHGCGENGNDNNQQILESFDCAQYMPEEGTGRYTSSLPIQHVNGTHCSLIKITANRCGNSSAHEVQQPTTESLTGSTDESNVSDAHSAYDQDVMTSTKSPDEGNNSSLLGIKHVIEDAEASENENASHSCNPNTARNLTLESATESKKVNPSCFGTTSADSVGGSPDSEVGGTDSLLLAKEMHDVISSNQAENHDSFLNGGYSGDDMSHHEDDYDKDFLKELHGTEAFSAQDAAQSLMTPSNEQIFQINAFPVDAPNNIPYSHSNDPYTWTPTEIKAATGNEECTTVEHNLRLRSVYSDVKDSAGTKDASNEPQVTSYNTQFMGTVDYIWCTESLQTVKILDTFPKHILQQTKGFPTRKWGSDHVSLMCQLAFKNERPA